MTSEAAAASLNSLGDLARTKGRLALARRHFEAAARVMRELVAARPGTPNLQRSLSDSLLGLGRISALEGHDAEARLHLTEGVGLLRALVASAPPGLDLRKDLSRSLHHLGMACSREGQTAEAQTCLEASLLLTRQLAEVDPEGPALLQQAASVLNYLGNIARRAGRQAVARRHFEEALDLRSKALVGQPQDVESRFLLANSHWNLYWVSATAQERTGRAVLVRELLLPLRDLGIRNAMVEKLLRLATAALQKPGGQISAGPKS